MEETPFSCSLCEAVAHYWVPSRERTYFCPKHYDEACSMMRKLGHAQADRAHARFMTASLLEARQGMLSGVWNPRGGKAQKTRFGGGDSWKGKHYQIGFGVAGMFKPRGGSKNIIFKPKRTKESR